MPVLAAVAALGANVKPSVFENKSTWLLSARNPTPGCLVQRPGPVRMERELLCWAVDSQGLLACEGSFLGELVQAQGWI